MNDQQILLNESRSSTGEKNKETQYYMIDQNVNNENNDIDPRAFHRQGIHPSREQLSFDELGKVYTNISKRRMVSKASVLTFRYFKIHIIKIQTLLKP